MVKAASFIPIIAGLIGTATAHTRVYGLWVNGEFQGDGRDTYIRSPPTNDPVKNISSTDIICNVNNVAVASQVDVAPGDQVTFEWYHDTRGDDIIDSSHKGPITVYLADQSTDGSGDVWTKIAETGLSSDGSTWAVDTLIADKGMWNITLPSELAAGNYLLRAEIIALHEADTNYMTTGTRGAQFYASCSQITVSGGGTATPDEDFNFIGGYSESDPGILYNLYSNDGTYTIPGPSVWPDSSSASSGSSSTAAASTTTAAATMTAASSTSAVAEAATSSTSVSFSNVATAATSTSVVATIATETSAVETSAIATSAATTSTAQTSTAAPTTMVTSTRSATTTSAPVAATSSSSSSSGENASETMNQCLDKVNVCIANAQSKTGGAVDFSSCESQRTACYAMA